MKYLGSKASIAQFILPIITEGRNASQWYVEPFAGGMNTICRVDGPRLASDSHIYLIQMWEALINGWVPPAVSRQLYYEVKGRKDAFPPHLVGWVGFNCSYAGKWFDGFAGLTQTKSGLVRDYQDEALRNILSQAKSMHGVVLTCNNYYDLQIPANSIVYCDPPYEGARGYRDKIDHVFFWDWVRRLSANGHRVFVSEYGAPPDFVCVWSRTKKSSLSANGKTGGSIDSTERLFVPRTQYTGTHQ